MDKSKQSGRFGAGRDNRQYSNYKSSSKNSPSFSPDERLDIFISASKSLHLDSTIERDARIYKWLHNCKNAN